MQKQQGFILPLVIVVVALAVLGTAGYFVYHQYTANSSEQPDQNEQQKNQTAGWQTYANSQYGFEFQYPITWEITSKESSIEVCEGRAQGACYYDYVTLGFSADNPPTNGMFPKGCPSPYVNISLTKSELVGKPNLVQPNLFNSELIKVNGLDAEKITAKQSKDTLVYVSRNDKTFVLNLGCLGSTNDKQKYIDDFSGIISTFKFTNSQALTCKDELEGLPVITSISPQSGSVGTTIELNGCNFNGFESDFNAWIENNQGIKGIMYSEPGSTSKNMKFTLKSAHCQQDTSYSGLPCPTYLQLTPGNYKIYTSPWGNKSNIVNFEITK